MRVLYFAHHELEGLYRDKLLIGLLPHGDRAFWELVLYLRLQAEPLESLPQDLGRGHSVQA